MHIPFFFLSLVFLLLTSKTEASIKEIIPNITAIKIAVTLIELKQFSSPQMTLWFIITLV